MGAMLKTQGGIEPEKVYFVKDLVVLEKGDYKVVVEYCLWIDCISISSLACSLASSLVQLQKNGFFRG